MKNIFLYVYEDHTPPTSFFHQKLLCNSTQTTPAASTNIHSWYIFVKLRSRASRRVLTAGISRYGSRDIPIQQCASDTSPLRFFTGRKAKSDYIPVGVIHYPNGHLDMWVRYRVHRAGTCFTIVRKVFRALVRATEPPSFRATNATNREWWVLIITACFRGAMAEAQNTQKEPFIGNPRVVCSVELPGTCHKNSK